jgi:diguanylate cyclase
VVEWSRRASTWRAAVLLSSGLLAALVVAFVSMGQPERGVVVGGAFAGVMSSGTGVVVLVAATRRVADLRAARLLLGLAMLVWGAAQVVLAVEASVGRPTFPALGDQIGIVAAPLGVIGILLALRQAGSAPRWLRVLLDAALLGTSTALMLWRVAFHSAIFLDGPHPADVLASVIIVVEITMVALTLLAWLRDPSPALLLALAGLALYCVADQYTLFQVVPGRASPWPAAAISCLAWPVIGEGVLRLRRPRADVDDSRSETRVTLIITTVSLVGLLGAMAAIAADRYMDTMTVVLGMAVIVSFGARETYTGLQRGELLRTLTVHAFHDPLTGLGNRRAMSHRLRQLAGEPAGAVLTVDLDGFKEVNDQLGHERGDDLLVLVASRITAAVDDLDAFRVGGDEFIVLVPGPPGRDRQLAQTLLDDIRAAAPQVPGAVAVGVSASIGIARWDGCRADQAVVESGVALHAAKHFGRDRVESYDGPVAAGHRRASDLERRLRLAVAAGHIDVHYQPVLRLRDEAVVGFEALARWVDPVLGRVGPDEFILAAERSGLISALGEHVMRRALGDLVELSRAVPGARIAVNVSPVQLRSSSFAADVVAVLAEHDVEPGLLVVEVTESALLGEDAVELGQLHELRRHGILVAIDDFGSGYSSLAYLSRLPASTLKLDQGLVANLSGDQRALAVMRSIIELGHALPLELVVEGIETTQGRDVVRGLGAHYGQGWLYSPAVPLAQVADVVRTLEVGARLAH